jgi:O-antigen ligase
MDAARADPGGDDELYIEDRDASGRLLRAVTGARLPLHPHNIILQWWLELGVLGGLLLATGLWGLVRWLGRDSILGRDGRAALSAQMVAGIVVSAVSYGAWQSWWLASLWVAMALGMAVAVNERSKDEAAS